MQSRGLFLLLWVTFIHFAGIYLYTKGFLLTRLSLSEISTCAEGDATCTLVPSHKRVVLLVIDALRFDFLSPNPPSPASPYHHNVLRIPAELSAQHPDRSLLFTSFADPPTTTLQRIKGITAGSLPTFIDMGSNFGGYSILEDSLIGQLRAAGKKIAFMGDDTWTTVFPTSFEENMTFPYDSFNVEDLHTVDEGVIEHLFPLLKAKSKPWDFIIGHFLGVDHVGHRVGPDHPVMKTKLEQMDRVLRDVVDLLDDETLLVLMGDHGMDRKGDHGGDTELEVTAAVWFYSKGRPLLHPQSQIPETLLPKSVFPGATVPHRAIQQIDLVPTLSLLLGLPIPYNNLGSLVPELFWDDLEGRRFNSALEMNFAQVDKYLRSYRASPHGSELDNSWAQLQKLADTAIERPPGFFWTSLNDYMRHALTVCRELWAQFNITLIGMGLTLLTLGTFASWELWTKLGTEKEQWEAWEQETLRFNVYGLGAGLVFGIFAIPFRGYVKGLEVLHVLLFAASLASVLACIFVARPKLSEVHVKSLPVLMVLHAAAFGSNSFTVWEDRIITFLLLTSIVPDVMRGFSAPTARLRYRILGFSALFAACVRLMAASTVCREEQQPHCHVTFYASASLTAPPLPVLLAAIPTALALPFAIRRFLQISQSDKGVAGLLLPWIVPTVLLQGTLAWMSEWVETAEVIDPMWSSALRLGRTALGWGSVLEVLVIGCSLWWAIPLCLRVSTSQATDPNGKTEVTVIGFANAYGAPYLMFFCIPFGLFYTFSQLTAQIAMGLAVIAVLAYLEVVDSVRDVRSLEAAFASSTPSDALNLESISSTSATVRFSEVVPLALLSLHAFYATGHQSTISSIQWKSAFALAPTLVYPLAPASVVANTFGAAFVLALGAPLLALWNVPPLPHPAQTGAVRREAARAALGVMLYHGALLLGSAAAAAWLRRHLMVWKIFAPRFMYAAGTLVVTDVALLLGVGVGVRRVTDRVAHLFAGMAGSPAVEKKTQ
ncbi:GPI ethanolamine phosphate transferase 3 [Phanerochaete sordida]|uniref:GPI ethanolamine phosphate transferase 3 n=1 Tax=Phanerochaete sordida TaxID=48140 RepID=A0A9P3GR89_9APHY|nr:GPI ethanolamine phosphate transferase 3 [Phanerochaete sordida]